MPTLSRLDLRPIVDAVRELHRTIENPPSENWQAPTWLVERYKQTTAGKIPVQPGETPGHAWLINIAAEEVLHLLTPPWRHRKPDCPEITKSLLDQRHKLTLIDLRDRLSSFAFGQTLVEDSGEFLRALAFLESAVDALEDSSPPTPQDIRQNCERLRLSLAPESAGREAVMIRMPEFLRNIWAHMDRIGGVVPSRPEILNGNAYKGIDLFSAALRGEVLPEQFFQDALRALDDVVKWAAGLNPDAVPTWKNGVLSFLGTTVKTFKRHPAKRQRQLLDAFEANGWKRIENPFRYNGAKVPSELTQTMKDLNLSIKGGPLRFEGDGCGGCRWVAV